MRGGEFKIFLCNYLAWELSYRFFIYVPNKVKEVPYYSYFAESVCDWNNLLKNTKIPALIGLML